MARGRLNRLELSRSGSVVNASAVFFAKGAAMFVIQHARLNGPGTGGMLAAYLLAGMPGGGFSVAFPSLESSEQTVAGKLPIDGLRAGILDADDDIGGQMAQGDAGGDLVDILAARPRRAGEALLQFSVVQMCDGAHGKAATELRTVG